MPIELMVIVTAQAFLPMTGYGDGAGAPDADGEKVEPAARCRTLPLAAGRRDRQLALEIGREVGVDLAAAGDLDNLRRIPLHGCTSHWFTNNLNMRSGAYQGKSIFLEYAIRNLDQRGDVGLS